MSTRVVLALRGETALKEKRVETTTREVRDVQTEAEASQVDVQLNWERRKCREKRNAKAPHIYSRLPSASISFGKLYTPNFRLFVSVGYLGP